MTGSPHATRCPDCKQGEIEPGGQCPVCGLTHEALLDAEAWLENQAVAKFSRNVSRIVRETLTCAHGRVDSDDCDDCHRAAAPHGGF
jgi:hypothetical protein